MTTERSEPRKDYERNADDFDLNAQDPEAKAAGSRDTIKGLLRPNAAT